LTNSNSLKRNLTLPLVTFYGLGNILGAGIYVLVGKVAGVAGMFTPIAFLLSSVIATFSAFTYAELSARFPVSAGEAVYIQHGFNKKTLSILVGLLIAVAGMVSAATIANGFVGYFKIFVDLPDTVILISLVSLLTLIAFWGIEQSVKIAVLLTLIEIFGLLLIIFVGRHELANISTYFQDIKLTYSSTVYTGIFLGAFLAFYAFIGFEDMVNVAEEVKNPHKIMPIAILLALIIATVLYFLVSYIAIMIVPPNILNSSDAPLALMYQRATGAEPIIISLISMFAVVNGALIQIIMAARIFYGMAKKGWISEHFSRVHPKTRTPHIATFTVGGSILVLALWIPLIELAKTTSFLILIIFCLVNLALIKIKIHTPNPENIKTYPMIIPSLGALLSAMLVTFQLFNA